MDKKDLDSLLQKIFSSKEVKDKELYDYQGYGLVSDLKMSKEQVKEALAIMWSLCMEYSKEERDNKFLFGQGLIKSKEIFLTQKESGVNIPKEKEEKFKEKLENIRPLIEFLVKMKEVI